jgi:hypothetical protein
MLEGRKEGTGLGMKPRVSEAVGVCVAVELAVDTGE